MWFFFQNLQSCSQWNHSNQFLNLRACLFGCRVLEIIVHEIDFSIMIHSLILSCRQRTFFPHCFAFPPLNKEQQRSEEPMATFIPTILNYLFRH